MKKTKSVTIKDVAKEAGVSVATVSYVINNNKDQTISEATKQKIWQVINLLNYKPSVFAKNLRMASSYKLIAVYSDCSSSVAKAEYMMFLENLNKIFSGSYGLLFQNSSFKESSNVDAIIAYNVTNESFYHIGNQSYVPLIALDSDIDDPLFFQITSDYEKIKKEADQYFDNDYLFVAIKPSNEKVISTINKTFKNVAFINNLDDLNQINETNILTTDYIINSFYTSKKCNVLFNKETIKLKCEQVAKCLSLALSHEPFDIHNYKI